MLSISRREFLKLSGCGLGAFACGPLLEQIDSQRGLQIVRVTAAQISIRREPAWSSEVSGTRQRDELLNAYYEVEGEGGRNPLWYRVWGGYAHSAYLHPARVCFNTPLTSLPAGGQLAEVSVPYTQSMLWQEKEAAWVKNYRLYYGTTHWLNGLAEGPDGQPWYRITDSFERSYFAPAAHLRPIPPEELAPISPGLDPADKYIQVDIAAQTLTAYEQGREVLHTRISSGLMDEEPPAGEEIPSDTPAGDYHITVKTPSRHMGDKKFSGEIETTALPGVPWVCFFDKRGYSLHGTFWHNNFGYRMSHGCINMRTEEARWIYRWAQPEVPPGERWFSAWGTRVSIV